MASGASRGGKAGKTSAGNGDDLAAEKLSLAADDEAGRTSLPAPPLTPMMAQYAEIKAANPDCLLFYRMGDFYELFFEDAVAASQALGIQLTKRGKHQGEDIPMCGVPVHAADDYLQRLIKRGFRVAVCEQLEDPAEAKKRGSKSVVKRDVIRLVTAGTLTEESLLEPRTNNFLTAVAKGRNRNGSGDAFGLASLDISTGEFAVSEIAAADLVGELVRLSCREIVLPDALFSEPLMKQAAELAGATLTPVPAAHFDARAGERAMRDRYGVADLQAFGGFQSLELAAVAALLKYVDLTQIGRRPVLRVPRRLGPKSVMMIDAASRASLEIVRTIRGERAGSLLHAIDRTVTAQGARELAARLQSPLREVGKINERLDATGYLVDDRSLRADLRALLRGLPDVQRAIGRLALGRGAPRDLGLVRDGLSTAREIGRRLAEGAGVMGLPSSLRAIQSEIGALGPEIGEELAKALVDAPPLGRREPGFVRQGYRADLDECRRLEHESRDIIAGLQLKYQTLAENKSLKVRHNNILGYFIEVGAAAAKGLMQPPLSDVFRHRQTMASAGRFTTAELEEVEAKILGAGEAAAAIESEVFDKLCESVLAAGGPIGALATALAELDVFAGLAEIAEEQGYVRPRVEEGTHFHVLGGRHPVVEQALKKDKAGPFIDNDCVLGRAPAQPGFEETKDALLWLVTGPNMAGKSTFLRQNALIAIMAQMGSFVPAREAAIGSVDRLFSRVGAADDLARGRSTFMVEMVETAAILNQATKSSLVILDEIGRGTATFDGLSIAWACVEHLHDRIGARTLFATHYHELTVLAEKLERVANVTIEVKEWQDGIVFLHKVKPGAADRSYGIQVAKLAGLPAGLIRRAREVLDALEAHGRKRSGREVLEDLPLFGAAAAAVRPPEPPPDPIREALSGIDCDALSPREALEKLYALKALLGN